MRTSQRIYEKRTIIKTTVEQLMAFHQDLGMMPKLTPPPIFVQIHRDGRQSLTEGELEFTLWFGPIPVRWLARHQPGPTEYSFADLMVTGPLDYWWHEHIFQPLPEGVALIDRVTFTHRKGLPGVITRLVFDGLPLRILFFYRHLRTKKALTRRK